MGVVNSLDIFITSELYKKKKNVEVVFRVALYGLYKVL